MERSQKNVCLINQRFTAHLDRNLDPALWKRNHFDDSCRTSFGIDITIADYVVIPLCEESHFFLVIIDVKAKKAIYFDSGNSKREIRVRKRRIQIWFENLTKFVWNQSGWDVICDPDNVNQPDSNSCGVFVAMAARRFLYNDVMLINSATWQLRARYIMALSILCSKMIIF